MTARVLIVDDIATNLKLLEIKLRHEYYDVLSAPDGGTALDIAKKEQPDVILLDVMMPGINGFEVCRILKNNYCTISIPVIMITALNDVEDRRKGLESGADDFITKPINDSMLYSRIRSLLLFKGILEDLKGRYDQIIGTSNKSKEVALNNMINSIDHIDNMVIDILSEDMMNCAYLRFVLESISKSIDIKEDPYKFLAHISEHKVDLVILDGKVSKSKIMKLCSQIRATEQTRFTPIIVMIEDDLESINNFLAIGVNDFIIIPIDPYETRSRVRTQLRQKRLQDIFRSSMDNTLLLSSLDSLTGIYNRRYLDLHLKNYFDGLKENTDINIVSSALLMIDIDFFKDVNDQHGHLVGDELLRQMTNILNINLRETDILARFGGEEFIVFLYNAKPKYVHMIAERLVKVVANHVFKINNQLNLHKTISIGVYTIEDNVYDANFALEKADQALYYAKKTRNTLCIYSDLKKQEKI
ncbi:MAG: response regulator [Candidatus Xenolissoclinum pacificiensis L6]|uniref:diguanylate cyclase n=1 Tax=Candidatus Xenolissoclinum pacificiensis L6 TaxID=1401685 RepID=W2UZ42_9RICK|nr:MAG: response regulator [Candidatus Xenolissoclinum pacificiensis L6]